MHRYSLQAPFRCLDLAGPARLPRLQNRLTGIKRVKIELSGDPTDVDDVKVIMEAEGQ